MHCPFCRNTDSRVVDSRTADDGGQIRRRRQCPACNRRFTTIETASLSVLKRSGVTEPFSRSKVLVGVRKACQGRPVSEDDLAVLAQQVEETIRLAGSAEVDAHEVGMAILGPLRELDEEVGVALPETAVLGLLDDYPTRSGYVITPVVVWGGGRLDLRPSPDEVVAVYRVGLHQLLREDSPRFITIPESPRPVVQIPLGNDLIHAPTGAVLLQLRWLGLEGRADPVDELEQPVFAWR